MATLVDYERLVRLRGYDGATDPQVDDAINEGRRRLVRDHRWSWLEAVDTALVSTPNDAEVSLAAITDLAHVDAVRVVIDGEPVETDPLSVQDLRSRQATQPATGRPRFWARRNGVVLLYPTPDQAYALNVDYVQQPAALSSGTDSVVPDELQDLVAWAATPVLAFRQRDAWAIQNGDAMYTNLLTQAISADNIRQRQKSAQVRTGYWGSTGYGAR